MTDKYIGWAVLELMGHRQRVGCVREVEMFGGKLLRIDIPTGDTEMTEFYGCSSVYALRPVSEEIARDLAAERGDLRPVKPVEYRLETPPSDDLPYDPDPDLQYDDQI